MPPRQRDRVGQTTDMSLTRVDGAAGPAAWRIPSAQGELHVRVTPVDAVGLEARAARLAGRSIKAATKQAALDLAIACVDLTTLEGMDTPGKVRSLARKGASPEPGDPTVPSVAAVCVYPTMVPHAVLELADSGVKVASVAGAFPSSLSTIDVKVADIESAVGLGADEIDIVIDRGAFLAGEHGRVFDEIERSKEACGDAHLKVILETGELRTYERVRTASMLAMAAGADFIKTSTGKVNPASTLPTALCMAEAIRDYAQQTGRPVGSEGRRRDPHLEAGMAVPGDDGRDARAGVAHARPLPDRRVEPARTTCCCNGASWRPAATPTPAG